MPPCTCPNVPAGSCYGCSAAAFGIDPGPKGASSRAAVRGFILGGVAGLLFGGPAGLLWGGGVSAALNALFGDLLDRKLRGA